MFMDALELADPVLPEPEFLDALDDRAGVEGPSDFSPDWPTGRIDEECSRPPSLSDVLAMLLHTEPCSEVVEALARIEAATLSEIDAVTYLQVQSRVTAWLAALQVEALIAAASPAERAAEFTVLVPESDEERQLLIVDIVRDEIAAALRRPGVVVQGEIDTARLLVGPLSETLGALRRGEVSWGHVRVIADAAERLPGRWMRDPAELAVFTEACAVLQERVLAVASRATVSSTRAAVRRAVLAIDAEGESRRRQQAKSLRDVWVSEDVDGMSLLIARLTTERAHAVLRQVDALARTDLPGIDPGARVGERRAHALAALVLDDPGGAVASRRAAVRAHLDIVIDLSTLLSLRQVLGEGSVERSACGVVELRGAGPVSVDVVRDLLGDPTVAVTMRRLITEPMSGILLDYGRTTYRVPAGLRDFINGRDQTCRFPGCRRRADRAQIDHAIAWDDGGTTRPANLGALCTRHHQLKTLAGWDITESRADGSCRWRSPHGRSHDRHPPPY